MVETHSLNQIGKVFKKTSQFIPEYRNLFWIEKIKEEVDIYLHQHNLSSPPKVVTIVGHAHLDHLKQLFSEEQQTNLHLDL